MVKIREIVQKSRGQIVRILSIPLLLAVCAVALSAFASDEVIATASAASTIVVDLREDVCRAVGSTAICGSPKWGGVTNVGAYVVLEKVEHVGQYNEVTNILATFDADAENSYLYTAGTSGEGRVRLIHRVYSAEDEEIGKPLIRDLIFGFRSGAGTAFAADGRTNSLHMAAIERMPINLSYSMSWATNAASVNISAVSLSEEGGLEKFTNALFFAAAAADGVIPLHGVGRGWWRLVYQLKDEGGETLLEYLTCDFKMPGGLVISVR